MPQTQIRSSGVSPFPQQIVQRHDEDRATKVDDAPKFTDLPGPCLTGICSHLDFRSIARLAQTSKACSSLPQRYEFRAQRQAAASQQLQRMIAGDKVRVDRLQDLLRMGADPSMPLHREGTPHTPILLVDYIGYLFRSNRAYPNFLRTPNGKRQCYFTRRDLLAPFLRTSVTLWPMLDSVTLQIHPQIDLRDKHLAATALGAACLRGDQEMVVFFLEAGVSVNAADHRGQTAFMSAMRDTGNELFFMLLDAGPDLEKRDAQGQTALAHAVKAKNMSALLELIAVGANVNAPDRAGQTPLHFAVKGGCAESVAELIGAGANIDAADERERTPLFLAAEQDQGQIGHMLIVEGANINALTRAGQTPVFAALARGNVHFATLLIHLGANVDFAQPGTPSLLMLAVKKRQQSMVDYLLAVGADVNHRGYKGQTALMVAASGGNFICVLGLLRAEADAHLVCDRGYQAVDYARRNNHGITANILARVPVAEHTGESF